MFWLIHVTVNIKNTLFFALKSKTKIQTSGTGRCCIFH